MPCKRSPEDLRMYNFLFPELFEIECSEGTNESIVIPTGAVEAGLDYTKSCDTEKIKSGIFPLSAGNLSKSASTGSGMYRMATTVSEFPDSSYGSGRAGQFSGANTEYVDSYSRSETGSKPGASVISIDFPMAQSLSTKSSGAKKPTVQKSKKSKGSKRPGKDRKPKKSIVKDNSDTIASFTSSLCITPIPNIVDPDEEIDQNFLYDDDDDIYEVLHDPAMYQEVARLTKSVYKFEKIAYPDFVGATSPYDIENLYHRKFGVQR